ncbi:MAG: hypothetical protein DWQ31_15665 [Planctomycetota bacterium]|nr:MAG: hypothetical protein DWQ31_15665 [Planctomycetota bacterium]REJ89964.1 MAG: hypothetical protein DWQ35_17250 [Planctomycetota bacterium]REK28196.1 MAG: hypothetical protein DWQ42_05630 [Planctomycetota bacterium]REK42454.1 MAG: hypothetical protein DWQ46_13270 [Planctomycetota bacterium]
MKYVLGLALLAACALFGATENAQADIVILKSGGEVRGEVVNADEASPERFTIRLYSGGELEVDADQVARVERQRPLVEKYEQRRGELEDTVEAHWEMAQWCRQNRLRAQREFHLRRVIQLDPDHAGARRQLGYKFDQGAWKTEEEIERAKGKVKYKGRWRFPEDIKLDEQRRETERQRKAWYKTVGMWASWLDDHRAQQARTNILAIEDPLAVDALVRRLEGEDELAIRKIYAKALTNLATTDAIRAVVDYSIEDEDRDFREYCFDLIDTNKPEPAFEMYLAVLASGQSTNTEINRAAIGLKYLGNAAAIPALIDRLITVHRIKLGGGPAGSTTTTFGRSSNGSGGTGFGTGQPKYIKKEFTNGAVLDALRELTGEDFGFSVNAWQAWYAREKSRKRGPRLNPRRD